MMLNLHRQSVFLRPEKNIPVFPKYDDMKTETDICIVGSGIVGLSCAIKLYEQGKKFIMIEASKIAQGVSTHSTAKLTSQHTITYVNTIAKHGESIGRAYAEMNEWAINDAENVIKNYKIECDFKRVPHIVYTDKLSMVDLINREVHAAKKCGINAEFVDKIEELPFHTSGACLFPNQAYFNIYEYLIGIANYLKSNGCEIYENSRVTDVSWTSPHTVTTENGGIIKANHVILATHMPILDRSGHFASGHPTRLYCIAITLKDNSKVLKNMYISADPQGDGGQKSLRPAGFKDEYGDDIMIVAGNSHPVGDTPYLNTEIHYKGLIEWAEKQWDVKRVVCGWSAHDYEPNDNLPYIGYLHYGTHSLYCGVGFKKWGFTQGIGAGKIITDLICNGPDQYFKDKNSWHSIFDARRWDLSKSILTATAVQAFVGMHFFKDRIEDSKLFGKVIDIEDLAKDTGNICKDKDGNVMAAYRDDKGVTHCVSHVCQHLGCHVRWNQAERSWDCPCHGSRYDVDGNILHGPTVKPLPRYPLK